MGFELWVPGGARGAVASAVDTEQILQTAQQLAEQQMYPQALAEYDKLLRLNAADTRVLLRVGDVQARARDFRSAIQTYDRAAGYYSSQGATLKAVAVYKQVRELIHQHEPALKDEYAHVVERLTALYVELELVNEALRTLDEEAARLRELERDEAALGLFYKMTDLGPNLPLPHLRLAEGLYRVGKVDDAMRSFSSATKLLLASNQTDDALRVLERMLHLKPDPKQAKLAAKLYLDKANEAEGMQALHRLQLCFQADPTDLETLHLLARAFELIGHHDRSIEVQKELARLAHEQGNADVFRFTLEQLQARAPHDEQVEALVRLPPPEAASMAPPASAAPPSVAPPSVAPPSVPPSVAPPSSGAVLAPVSPRISSAPGSQSVPPLKPGHPSIPPPKPAARATGKPLTLELVSSHPPPPSAGRGAPSSRAPARVAAPPAPTALGSERKRPPPAPSRRSMQPPPPPRVAAATSGRPTPAVPTPDDGVVAPLEAPPSSGRALVDFDDVLENSRRALADAQTYRSLSLFQKGIEVTRSAIIYDPQSIELREMLRDLYSDVGDRDGAIDEMLTMASIYIEFEHPEHALLVLQNVLDEEPGHAPALRLLDDMYQEHPELRRPSIPGAATSSAATSSAPASAPPASRPSAPGGNVDRITLESEQARVVAMPPPSRPASSAPAPSLDDTLEEVEFFSSRGMFGEARRLLEAQLQVHPEHPLLLDALQEIEELVTDSQASRDLSAKIHNERSDSEAGESLHADLRASLNELENAVRASMRPPPPGAKRVEIDVDTLFENFKLSVKAQVSDGDAATHYDLGLAYKDMHMLDDAIEELELAARDPDHECNAQATIGLIYAEQNLWDKAHKAYSRALDSQHKNPQQEASLYYDLGNAAEMLGELEQATYYFRQALRRDVEFRDARARVDALRNRGSRSPSGRTRAPDEDVDRAFEEILGD